MLDNTTALAYSVFHNKGIYALLLGSGVSRSAGIPTGWEITTDLIRQIAVLSGEDAGPDPEMWLKQSQGMDADYSKLLDALGKTPAERQAVLARYIEPTNEERAEGQKMPTQAHRSIAELIRRGYFRVVITTNFDRLLETALKDVGVEPTIIASEDAANGAVPITHAQCTIIKIHGDYLDTRIKNTSQELAVYPQALDALLDRIFDEFGIIVCGWSATWDPALIGSLTRCPSRRYSMYWATRGEPTSEAKCLADQRKAQFVSIGTADKFFSDLDSKVLALEEFARPHPLSAEMGVAMVKRYIVDEGSRIKLNDLLEDTYEEALGLIPQEMLGGSNWSNAEYLRRTAGYEAALASLIPMLAVGARWSEPRDQHLWIGIVRRLYSIKGSKSGCVGAEDFTRYLAMLAYYAVGVGAVSGGRFGLLLRLLSDPIDVREDQRWQSFLDPYHMVDGRMQNLLPGRAKSRTPLSDHLASLMENSVPRDVKAVDFDESFDTFEILAALSELDSDFPMRVPNLSEVNHFISGRYLVRTKIIFRMVEELKQGVQLPWLEAGFVGGLRERAAGLLSVLFGLAQRHGRRLT